MSAAKSYDAIVVGGGHNGLVNGAYLARAGLNTLVLERRHLVGGAAITEPLVPGYQFTTFSYAISLLRPDIVHDLGLVEHGLMVMPLANTFQPDLNGDYLLLGADPYENLYEMSRLSPEDADASQDLDHRIARLVRALKPWMDRIPPNAMGSDPSDAAVLEELKRDMAGLAPELRSLLDRFLNTSAADILDETFECELIKALYASSGIIGSRCSPRDKASGLVWLFHKMGDYDDVPGEWYL